MRGWRNLSFQPAKGSTRANRYTDGTKVKETSSFLDLFVFLKDGVFTAVKRNAVF